MTNTIMISRMRAVLAALAAMMLVMGTALPAQADIEDFVDRTFCAYDHSRDGAI